MVAIQTDGLTKRFGDVHAVQDLDLAVEEGEVFGFLGPNGAGKSTTINVLLDFMRPSGGSATVLGHDAQAEAPTIRKKVGILPEGFDLYDRLTGYEHVRFVARMHDATVDADALLDRVGLKETARDRAAGGYSTGMRQRLALGMALVGDPDLLILDEPSSGLDPNGMAEVRELVREEAESGTTVFFSSHILDQVEAVCDRVGIMNDGRLVAVDTIDGLREMAGSGATLTLSVDRVPEDLSLSGVAGVTDVTASDGAIRVRIDRPSAKAAAIARLQSQTTVEDVAIEETSLEELFTTYTRSGTGDDADPATTEVSV